MAYIPTSEVYQESTPVTTFQAKEALVDDQMVCLIKQNQNQHTQITSHETT